MDEFTDTPALRAERIGPNPRYHWCHSCGWRWEHGHAGEHNCLANVIVQRDRLADWKRAILTVMPPMQEIGHALGIQLGRSVHDKILPRVAALKARIKELEDMLRAVLSVTVTRPQFDRLMEEAEKLVNKGSGK